MTVIQQLQRWYAQQCNGEWEHRRGVSIQSCDNPGWWVKIDLAETCLETLPFAPIAENVDQQRVPQRSRWLYCHVANGAWHGAGDESRLEEILSHFLSWAEANQPSTG